MFNESFHKKLESVQYNAVLAMTGIIWETNTETLYQELGLESLQNRCKLQRLRLFNKIYKDHIPLFLHHLIPKNSQSSYSLRATK